ncbi:MAG: carbohydrate ABC transporter permease [Chloroflexota bacterium]|nr:carbohydrate ABC transporter permease [Chloroflexota bacterium]
MTLTRSQKGIAFLVMFAAAMLFLFPYIWMVGTSLKTNLEASTQSQRLFPLVPRLDNYPATYEFMDFGRQLFNSVFVALGVTIGQLLLAAPAGYAFARIDFRGRNWLLLLMLAMLIIPFEALFVPIYVMITRLGWVNSYWALIIPSIANPFAVYVFRQFFVTLPADLEEAARVDGASQATVFWRIMLPLAQPAIVTIAVLTFLAEWGALLKPLVFTTSNDMRTLQVGLNFLNVGAMVSEPRVAWLMAGTGMVILIPMIVFIFGQRFFVESIARTGIK